MTNDISKMADKCEEEGLPVIAAALREADAELKQLRAKLQRFQDIFSPDVSIEMLEEGLQARAELHKLRAENKVNYENAVTVSDMLVKQGAELSTLRAELEAAKESLDTIFDHIESTIAIMRIAEEASNRLAALKEVKP